MSALAVLLQRAKDEGLPAIPLDDQMLPKYQTWEKGFEDFIAGVPFEQNPFKRRSKPLWEQGWRCAKRIDELVAEQPTLLGEL